VLEFLLIVWGVVAFLAVLTWEPMRRSIAAVLDLFVSTVLVLVISGLIWLFLRARNWLLPIR
jgi:hypothetical protein